MENKIYYGEYTLRHWIELILKKNVILPDYQRKFVWKENKVKNLITTLEKKEFIPPITIGFFESKNIILDGQQRLTSVLLAYLDLMPDSEAFKAKLTDISMGDYNEGKDEIDEYGKDLDNILEWTFRVFKDYHNKEEILKGIKPSDYSNLNLKLDDAFFEEHYLGFSYIVPKVNDVAEQQKFYSSIFRNINIQGESLIPQESRKALYYFNPQMPGFFAPQFCKNIKIMSSSKKDGVPFDFVRYMSLLSEYKKKNSEEELAYGFRSHMEDYYENYIYSVIDEVPDDKYEKFQKIFPNRKYIDRFKVFEKTISKLELIGKDFTSIIDMDLYFFGMIYFIVIMGKEIDLTNVQKIKTQVEAKITEYKSCDLCKRSPNAFKYMRPRVKDSIEIYSNCSAPH